MLGKALSADLRLPRPSAAAVERLARFVPTRRSLAVGLGVVAIAVGAYVIARETSVFAIHKVNVTGGSAALDAQVAQALEPLVGKSLVGLDGSEVLRRAEVLPTVVSVSYDRAFPNTLRVTIVAERPVAVLRDGASAWMVSARGRVMRSIEPRSARALPRIWTAAKSVRVGEVLPLRLGGTLAHVLAQTGALRSRVITASFAGGVIALHLRSGLNVVLGGPGDIPLKVAVAERVLQQLAVATRTVDVSVPSRPLTSPY